MLSHIRANLLLLAATLVLCCVLYPLTLWAVGQTIFPAQAEGSLVKGADGKTTVGSHLIAQAFTGNEYFKPRPSAAGNNGYDAAASGATNWAASNALLRDRVARQIGPIAKYTDDAPANKDGEEVAGKKVGPFVEKWFQKQAADYALTWAKQHPKLVEQWVKDNLAIVADLLGKNEQDVKGKEADNALPFFDEFAKREAYRGAWPTTVEKKVGDETKKVLEPVKDGDAVQAYFFDLWLRENKDAKLEKVPADMVMTSGSGLDPHITLKNALFQLDDVTDEWVKKTGAPRDAVRAAIEKVLDEKKFAPMGGLFGVEMVNVLEVNLELPKKMPPLLDKNKAQGGL
jgi:K+-transporting ATPase ATPase C chain